MFVQKKISEDELRDINKYKQFLQKNSWHDDSTSFGRFRERVNNWSEQPNGYLTHHFWWLLHNCLAHPLLGLIICKWTVNFHNWASDKLNQHAPYWKKTNSKPPYPVVKNRWSWMKHNIFAHLAIGLFPCMKTFYYHDKTGFEMSVKDWV